MTNIGIVSIIMLLGGVVCFGLGRWLPSQQICERLIAEGEKEYRRRMLLAFVERPWICVHVPVGGSHCRIAELVSGDRRISLPHLEIPHGAMVHFIEKLQGDMPHELTPFLGGFERELRMTVNCKPSLLGEEDCDYA